MAANLLPSRQRVPMLSADMLEDRTRPALDGSTSWRLRYFRWMNPDDHSTRAAKTTTPQPGRAQGPSDPH